MTAFQHIQNRWFADKYRKKLLNKPKINEALKTYLSTPLPDKKILIDTVEFVALDFETTGLDAKNHHIISLGYTLIKNMRISIAERAHILVKPKVTLSENNVAIHQLTDDELNKGITINQMMRYLFTLIRGRVVIVHFDKIEQSFINMACAQNFGVNVLPMRMLDTIKIEIKKRNMAGKSFYAQEMRLFNLRDQYNLPRYKAHNALQDAIATAELFLAQMAYTSNAKQIRLGDLL